MRIVPSAIACCALVTATGATGNATSEAHILYVDDDAPAGGDGTSWQLAFRYLQDALNAARNNSEITEIHVGQGTYQPDRGADINGGDKNSVFDIVDGVSMLGGFAGFGAADPDARDVSKFKTFLSGDLLANDGPVFTNYEDNSYRILRAANLANKTTIDGINVVGAQMLIDTHGGGLFCAGATSLHIRFCSFTRNWAYRGGGIGIQSGTVSVTFCRFEDNRAYGFGGGIVAPSFGSEIALIVEDCQFLNNHCQFEDGGAIQCGLAGTTVRRCDFIANIADDGGAINGVPDLVEDCLFQANHGDYGGAVNQGLYRRCRFINNSAHVQGGASATLSTLAVQPTFIDCDFIGNFTDLFSGGAAYGGKAFINCRFIGNQVAVQQKVNFFSGGALHAAVPCLIANCVFSGNQAGSLGAATGGAVLATNPDVLVVNSSFAGNTSASPGAAVSGGATIINSALAAHATPPVAGGASVSYSCSPQALPAGQGNLLADPRFVDPKGSDGIVGSEDDDLRLLPDSPCINAGNSLALPTDQFDLDNDGDTVEPLPLDSYGNARTLPLASVPNTGVPDPTGAVVDIGSHEFRRPADIVPAIGDGLVNVPDLLAVINGWGPCSDPSDCPADIIQNGVVDVFDLVAVVLNWG